MTRNGCRPPPGGRGLKHNHLLVVARRLRSPSTRGAWIETGALLNLAGQIGSPSTRGAWIETQPILDKEQNHEVALHPGGVD
mgnify:CR=1 FL=1